MSSGKASEVNRPRALTRMHALKDSMRNDSERPDRKFPNGDRGSPKKLLCSRIGQLRQLNVLRAGMNPTALSAPKVRAVKGR